MQSCWPSPGPLVLRAERKKLHDFESYDNGVWFYLVWCAERDGEPMSRAAPNLWVAGLFDGGAAVTTARSCQLAVRRFAAWLTEEGESRPTRSRLCAQRECWDPASDGCWRKGETGRPRGARLGCPARTARRMATVPTR
jgi:hypothetical protein